MTKSLSEGVIKYALKHRAEAIPLWAHGLVRELDAWRSILRALNFIGQDGVRYEGAAWGNVSARLPPWHVPRRPFLITGTQTGGVSSTRAEHYAVVDACDWGRGRVESYGHVRPSSEAMTHAAIYAADETLRFVFHAHGPEVWNAARRLELPCTPPDVAYGTPQMAWAAERLLATGQTREKGVIALLGHEDGFLTFGRTAEQAGDTMVCLLAKARALLPRDCG